MVRLFLDWHGFGNNINSMTENTKPSSTTKKNVNSQNTKKDEGKQVDSTKAPSLGDKDSKGEKPGSPNKLQASVPLPTLPLGQRESYRNQFNLAKAQADAAAAQAAGGGGSKISTLYPSSHRQSGSSQISFSSRYNPFAFPFIKLSSHSQLLSACVLSHYIGCALGFFQFFVLSKSWLFFPKIFQN